MKKASLLLALCLLLLPAGAMADTISFLIGGGTTVHNVGLTGCTNPDYPGCGVTSNLHAAGAPLTAVVTTPNHDLPLGTIGTTSFSTPILYPVGGNSPSNTTSYTWVVAWGGVGSSSITIDATGVLAAAIGVASGTPIFTGIITNGSLVSNHYTAISSYAFSAGIAGNYTDAFLHWADGCTVNCNSRLYTGTLDLGNSSTYYHLPGGSLIANGSISTSFNTPEPATLSLLGMGLVGLLGLRRRRS